MTDQIPNPGKTQGEDPRLLLPEWLRDDPPQREIPNPEPATAETPDAFVANMGGGVIDSSPPEQVSDSPMTRASGDTWEQPPPKVESYDPSHLIGAADLPSWIRVLGPGEQSFSLAPLDERIEELVIEPMDRIDSEPVSSEPATEIDAGEAQPERGVNRSDLSETGFVLIAGATVVIIVAVLALFYL